MTSKEISILFQYFAKSMDIQSYFAEFLFLLLIGKA